VPGCTVILQGKVATRVRTGPRTVARASQTTSMGKLMMKAKFLLTALLLSTVLPAAFSRPQQMSETTSKILALENKWNDAYKRGDVAAMNSMLADDFVITTEDGATFSKSGYIAHCGDPDNRVVVSEMTDLKVRVHGNTAVVTGAYHEKGTIKDKPYDFHDRMTDVWMLIDGRWQVIVSHYATPAK